MKNKLSQIQIYRLLLWVCAALSLLTVAFIIVFLRLRDVFNSHRELILAILIVFALVFTASSTLFSKAYHDQKDFVEQLMVENSYTLGKPTVFYNLQAFKQRVEKLRKRRIYREKGQYLLVFTPTAMDVSSNSSRNKLMSDLNVHIADFISAMFKDKNETEFGSRFNVYGFSRGVFLLYAFSNDDGYVHRLMNRISNECFRMVNENKIKIWVQPFFGIKRIVGESSITSDIEDALIARTHSEDNIESFTYFSDSFREDVGNESNEITEALQKDEFVPFYQAKYSLKEHRFVSTEVLARWKSPKYGLVGPSKFIDQAEKGGVLNAIDIRIFELAIKDLGDSLKRGRRTLPVSVNFSLYEFFSRNFLDLIVNTLKKYQVPPRLLEIEITETTSQANKFLSISLIKKLKDLGIRVLMDDFGVGYSQIENLRQIPFDAIKIDKSFTNKVLEDEKTRTIVKFLIELAHSNDMEVIIEGAETKEQVEILRKMRVDTIQGFYYTKPVSFASYNELLKSNQFEKEAKE